MKGGKIMTNQRVTDSFVAISDFHAMEWPLEKVKDYYLNEYEKIFILGDATDRGENGEGKMVLNYYNK